MARLKRSSQTVRETKSFVAELPLRVTAADERELSIRLAAARNIQNAVLGEALRRLDLMRESRAWRAACALPKTVGPKTAGSKTKFNPERRDVFKALCQRFGFRAGDLQKFAERCRDNCWIGEHLGSHDTQRAAERAFAAVERHAFGKGGRPRFRRFGSVDIIEGKSNAAVIRYRDGAVHYAGLTMPVMIDPRDRDGWQTEALSRRVKYCRIVRRPHKSRTRWAVQLVLEGDPPKKTRHKIVAGAVGFDYGPSSVALVGEHDALLVEIAPSVVEPDDELRLIRRAMDRSRRATNPENYSTDGTVKKGRKHWRKSNAYKTRQRQAAHEERRLAAARKRDHGTLANRALTLGNVFKGEDHGARFLQRSRYGRSVKRRGPGMQLAAIRRKAEAAGGHMALLPTRKLGLSQYDHTTDDHRKKSLSERWHVFRDGMTRPVQRDLYSAFLARCAEGDSLDAGRIRRLWPGAEPLLERAASGAPRSLLGRGQSASVPAFAGTTGIMPVGADRAWKSDVNASGATREAGPYGRCRGHGRRSSGLSPAARAAERRGKFPSEPPSFRWGRFSHHAPHSAARNPAYNVDMESAPFVSDCDDVLTAAAKVGVAGWIFGHHNWSCDVDAGGARLLSVRMSYPQERPAQTSWIGPGVLEI